MSLATPVLFIVYNRLETTKKVFSRIKEAKPPRIYIAADGPKKSNSEDKQRVDSVREFILGNIDWPTEVRTLFREENLGVKHAVNESLDWFFSFEEKGIILEDDCFPALHFFDYCEELLKKHENNSSIGMITGRNELGTYHNNQSGDYFMSTRGFIWGWATWKDRIKYLDVNISEKITVKEILTLYKKTSSLLEFVYRLKNIRELRRNMIDTWDYQWSIGLLLHSKFTLVPKRNMIRNIGLGEASTHKFQTDTDNVEYFEDQGKVNHPETLVLEKEYTKESIVKHTGGLFRILIPKTFVNIVRFFK